MSIMDSVKSASAKVGYEATKKAPEIFLGVGILGVIGGTVLACKATLKAPEIVQRAKEDLGTVEVAKECGFVNSEEEYTDQDAARDKTIVFSRTAWDFIKTYGPAALCMIGGIVCIVKGHNILSKRNAALTAAYLAIDGAYKKYKDSVAKKFGKKAAEELKHGIIDKELTIEKKDKAGKVKKEKEKKKIFDDPEHYSPYARFFDEGSALWTGDPSYDLTTLKNLQNTANDLLKARGWLSLNEVYHMLNLPQTAEGQIVGWTMEGDGDHYVDFGIFNGNIVKNRDFVNGFEKVILLDFNVDGPIFNDITRIERKKW